LTESPPRHGPRPAAEDALGAIPGGEKPQSGPAAPPLEPLSSKCAPPLEPFLSKCAPCPLEWAPCPAGEAARARGARRAEASRRARSWSISSAESCGGPVAGGLRARSHLSAQDRVSPYMTAHGRITMRIGR